MFWEDQHQNYLKVQIVLSDAHFVDVLQIVEDPFANQTSSVICSVYSEQEKLAEKLQLQNCAIY